MQTGRALFLALVDLLRTVTPSTRLNGQLAISRGGSETSQDLFSDTMVLAYDAPVMWIGYVSREGWSLAHTAM